MKRKSKLISKKKLTNMVKLFEEKIDEEISVIDLRSNIITTTSNNDYWIDFTKNAVNKSYPDPDW